HRAQGALLQGGRSGKQLVGRQSEEIGQRVGVDQGGNQLGRLVHACRTGHVAVTQAVGVCGQRVVEQREIDRRVVGKFQIPVMQPLPQLRAGDLGGGGVFHQ